MHSTQSRPRLERPATSGLRSGPRSESSKRILAGVQAMALVAAEQLQDCVFKVLLVATSFEDLDRMGAYPSGLLAGQRGLGVVLVVLGGEAGRAEADEAPSDGLSFSPKRLVPLDLNESLVPEQGQLVREVMKLLGETIQPDLVLTPSLRADPYGQLLFDHDGLRVFSRRGISVCHEPDATRPGQLVFV